MNELNKDDAETTERAYICRCTGGEKSQWVMMIPAILIAPTAAAADAVLDGGGKMIW